jgi:hypothetical protein
VLRLYKFDGSNWSSVTGKRIPGIATPTLATLSVRQVAFADAGKNLLRTYELLSIYRPNFEEFFPGP